MAITKVRRVSAQLIEFICALAVFLTLCVVSACCDLKIDVALYNPQSPFGTFFAEYGQFPTYLAILTVTAIVFNQAWGKTKGQKILIKVGQSILLLGGAYYFTDAIVGNVFADATFGGVPVRLYIVIGVSVIIAVAIALLTLKADKATMKKLLIFAIFLTVFIAVSSGIVHLAKILWHRQRFYTMADPTYSGLVDKYFWGTDFYEGFTPWYRPQWLFKNAVYARSGYTDAWLAINSDTFHSFPSGHTVAASASFGLIMLPDLLPRLRRIRWAFWLLPIAYTATVGISRLVVGAHFLSDITFGGYIGFGCAVLARRVCQKYINPIVAKVNY